MPDLKKMLTLEALSEALPSWLKRSTKPEYNADEIDSTLTTNQFVTASDKENWNAKGTYSKPSGGIPKSDLSSIVQTSLEKADSALQSETDPTVPSWAKQTNKPSYTQDEVADGSTYKRVTQTEKNTWNGKQNALTTTQMQAVNSGITSAGVAQISTNQTNILYVSEHNANRNLLLNTASTTTIDGVTFTVNADKSVTITGSQNNPNQHTKFVLGKFTANRSDLVLDSGIAASASANIFINTQDGVTTTRNLGHATITGTDLNTERDYQILVIAGTSNINTTIKPMICTQADWNATQEYEASGGLPNYDLTRMMTPFFTVPINHNMIYRGQNLGDTLTADQDTALSSGNFTDLYLGDYWTKTVTIPAGTYTGGDGEEVTVPAQTNITLKAVIADFDTFYAGYASTYAGINTHHAAVIVTGFSSVVWNKTNSTAGGYVASLIHKWLVGSALPQIETWFGSAKVLSHQKLLTNAITGDAASGWAWSSQKISLLSENQMCGSKVWGGSKAANGGYEPGEAFKHLNVFNHIDANLLFGNKNIWLRDIASAGRAASLAGSGTANYDVASLAGIAPAALILLS